MFERVCIATFSVYQNDKRTAINGMVEPLLSFFLLKTAALDLLDGPHPGSNTVVTRFEEHVKDKTHVQTSFLARILQPLLTMQNQNGTQIFFKLRDFLSVFELLVRRRKRYDLFIGLESVFTLSGIVLKKIGLVKTVVYYVSDYSPQRYPQKKLNDLYLWLDRMCCYNADYIWDVSPAMMPARIKAGLDQKKSKPCILVPNALFPAQINFLPQNKLQKNSIVFAGTFGFENGTKLAIEAMSIVVKKIPTAELHFFGGSRDLEEQLKDITRQKNITKNVIFHGFIPNATELSRKIQQYMIGLAPYVAIPGSARWYADATKIRLYMGAGLPAITTHVPPLGKEISKLGAGIVVKDSPAFLADAIITLLSDTKKYKKMRENAIQFAKYNLWENTYANALKHMDRRS